MDFVELSPILEQRGELRLYPLERMFVGKCLTFVNRKEFKDFYDLSYLSPKVAPEKLTKKTEIIELIQNVIATTQTEDVKQLFKLAFRNVDLRFKNLPESRIDEFTQNTLQKLRKVVHLLQR